MSSPAIGRFEWGRLAPTGSSEGPEGIASAPAASEEALEKVAESRAAAEMILVVPARVARAPTEILPLLPARTERVVFPALFRIAEHLVGLVHRLETLLRVGLVLRHVGMILARQFLERLLDVLLRGVLRDAQGFIIVSVFDGHVRWSVFGNQYSGSSDQSIDSRLPFKIAVPLTSGSRKS